MPPNDSELAGLVDAVIAQRPHVDTFRLTTALEALCRARDSSTDPFRREAINLLVTLAMAIKHPIGKPPWDMLVQARESAFLEPRNPAG